MKYLLFGLLFFTLSTYSQTNKITGVVINGSDNTKLPSASVFINNSTRGTTSDAEGKFIITGITETNFELVISYLGFATASIRITPENINTFQTIKLFPRKVDLKEVKIMSPEKNGWEKWGRLFTESFIGTSDFAKQCKIKNPEVLRFFYDEEDRILKAYSHGTLIINNKALGYNVRYQLEEFLYNAKAGSISYLGYTGFDDLNTKSKHREKKWVNNRKEAYKGSIMHFMRSVYTNTADSEGFDVKEKIRVLSNDSAFKDIYRNGDVAKIVTIDSNKYVAVASRANVTTKIPDYIDLISKKNFSIKNASVFDTATKQMSFYFVNTLRVIYKDAKEKTDYVLHSMRPLSSRTFQTSEINLIEDVPLVIEANGLYFDPLTMMSSGYWGWCKMAEMLPSDYKFEKENN